MNKTKIKSEIFKNCSLIYESIPAKMRRSFLLAGGSAAFLYGSDRPFSHDIDFIVSESDIPAISRIFDARFTYYKSKPVFHSYKTQAEIGTASYDLIAQSIVQPIGYREQFMFHLTEGIMKKKVKAVFRGKTIYLVPKELLILIKLLAGRGEDLKKYDLYDTEKMLENGKTDFRFLKRLIGLFMKPFSLSVPLLIKNAKRLKNQKDKNVILLLRLLESLPRSR